MQKENRKMNGNLKNEKKKELKDLRIKKQFYNILLNFDFPMQINGINSIIDVSLDIDGYYQFFSYVIQTEYMNIKREDYNSNEKLNVDKIVKSIASILENNLIIEENDSIEIKQKEDDIYEYEFKLEKREDYINGFKYHLEILRYRIKDQVYDTKILISFGNLRIVEKIDNIERIKIIKLILENMNIIEREVKNKIKEVIINKIENIE